ncbi:MAG TPA: DUF4398 domain-containing protein [Gammaproteobacteria bacterium]|nr:DUF4398 domain-containing protein [Gammaproteobacteria bacterium]
MPNSLLKSCVLFALLLMVSACAVAPVQEMSNARQAVAAAERAGAAEHAPLKLSLAKRLLQAAQQALDRRDYAAARDNAMSARREAVSALRITQGLETPESNPP